MSDKLQFVVNLVSIQVAVAYDIDKLKSVGRYLSSDQEPVSEHPHNKYGACNPESQRERIGDMSNVTRERWRNDATDVTAEILYPRHSTDYFLFANCLCQRPGIRRTDAQPAKRDRQ